MKRERIAHPSIKPEFYILDKNGKLLGVIFKRGQEVDKLMLDPKYWDIEEVYYFNAKFYETATDEEFEQEFLKVVSE